jgi:hypothetical protein
MPMFYTPKPRQFHYKPLFYDPEKEEWEKLKAKYRLENGLPLDDEKLRAESEERKAESTKQGVESEDKDLEYFQRKVRDIERNERQEKQKLTFADFFKKREKPQFHYVSRFDSEGNLLETPPEATKDASVKRRISRRFEDDDMDRYKPIPAGKIMIYTLLVCILLLFIFW